MKIGIVSDTHMPSRAKQLPKALVNGLKGVDLILHAGDYMELSVVKALEEIAPVEGVVGNNDGAQIRERFPMKQILTLNGYRVGLVHGDGMRKTTEQRAFETFADDGVDVIIFGHSHVPFSQTHQGILLFNPGSPTDKRRQTQYSFGILDFSAGIKAEHVFYDDKS